jgi:cell shape-determining protein MreC
LSLRAINNTYSEVNNNLRRFIMDKNINENNELKEEIKSLKEELKEMKEILSRINWQNAVIIEKLGGR